MSRVYEEYMALTEGGMDLRHVVGKHVCADCIEEQGLQAFVDAHAVATKCSYCHIETDDGKLIAVAMSELVPHMIHAIGLEWESADGVLPRDDETDEYMISSPISSDELLYEVGVTVDGDLHYDLVGALPEFDWCPLDPLRINKAEGIVASWKLFRHVITHERRFFFLQHSGEDLLEREESHEVRFPIVDLLAQIVAHCERADRFIECPVGTKWVRGRYVADGQDLDRFGARQLGPPPLAYATTANRMSPAGIPMFYGAEAVDTAFLEIRERSGTYVFGTFETLKSTLLLDLRGLSEIPSLFDEKRGVERPWFKFMQQFLDDFRLPVLDGRANVDYVPTQVVTEYIRTVARPAGRAVNGILYDSVKSQNTMAVVLFADTYAVHDPDDPPPEEEFQPAGDLQPWLRLCETSKRSYSAGKT